MPIEDKLRILIEQHGAENVTLGLKKVDSAFDASVNRMQQFNKTGTGVTRGMGAISKQSKNSGREMGMLVNTVGEMGYSFSTAIPPMRTMGTQMAMAGGNAVTLGAAFGPIGVGIGVLVGVLPSLISLIGDSSDEMSNAARSALNFATRLSQVQSRIEQMRSESRVESGMGSAQEQQALLEQEQAAVDNIRRTLREARREAGHDREFFARIEGLEEGLRQAEQRLRRAREFAPSQRELMAEDSNVTREEQERETREAMNEAIRKMREEEASGGRGGRGRAAREAERAQRELERAKEAAQREVERLEEERQRRIERSQEAVRRAQRRAEEEIRRSLLRSLDETGKAAEDLAKRAQEAVDEAIENINDTHAALTSDAVESIGELVTAWDEYNEALAAAGQTTEEQSDLMARAAAFAGNQIGDMIGDKATNAFQTAVGAWVDGSKSFAEAAADMAKAAIQAIVVEAIVRAAMEGAHAIAALASFNFAGAAAHAVAAAEYAGVALVAGAVGVATGAVGGGGDAPASSASTPRASDFDRPANDNAGGAPSITVIVNDPGDAARAGEVSQRHERAARQVYSGRV